MTTISTTLLIIGFIIFFMLGGFVGVIIMALMNIAKEEALRGINKAFGDNPEADAATMAQVIASVSNPLIDKAIITIKKEFNTL